MDSSFFHVILFFSPKSQSLTKNNSVLKLPLQTKSAQLLGELCSPEHERGHHQRSRLPKGLPVSDGWDGAGSLQREIQYCAKAATPPSLSMKRTPEATETAIPDTD